MWLSWGRIPRGNTTASASPPPFSYQSFAFSFSTLKDIHSLLTDDAPDPNLPAAAAAKKSSIFHRVRFASSALRSWRSLSSDPDLSAGEKRIVVYFTSLRVVRKTFEDCCAVRSILRGFRVSIDERDLSMDSGFLTDLKGILGRKQLSLPRVFIGGRYIGGAEEIQQLHETGELKKYVEGVPSADPGVCDCCGGVRFVLCQNCSGSRKCYGEKGGFRSCTVCNENGLVRCPDCCRYGAV